MYLACLTLPRRGRRGLTLIEALVTILLTSLAFSLIFSISRVQSRVNRFQEAKERFLVDADALFRVLSDDLATTFLAEGTVGSQVLRIGHLTGQVSTSGGSAPFNGLPLAGSNHPQPGGTAPINRGTSIRTTYTFVGERLIRNYAESSLSPWGAPAATSLTVLDGVNAAVASVNPPMVEIQLSLKAETRVHTIEHTMYAPGLVP